MKWAGWRSQSYFVQAVVTLPSEFPILLAPDSIHRIAETLGNVKLVENDLAVGARQMFA